MIPKTPDMDAAMDVTAMKTGVKALADAIGSVGKDGATTQAAIAKLNAVLRHMIASAGKEITLAVHDVWKDLVPAEVRADLRSSVNGMDAKKAYSVLMEFKDAVKAEAGTAAAALAARAPDASDAAVKTLSEDAYSFVEEGGVLRTRQG